MVGALELTPNRHSRRAHRNRYMSSSEFEMDEDSGSNWASSSQIFFLRTRNSELTSSVHMEVPFHMDSQLQMPLSRNLMPTPVRSSSSSKQNHSLSTTCRRMQSMQSSSSSSSGTEEVKCLLYLLPLSPKKCPSDLFWLKYHQFSSRNLLSHTVEAQFFTPLLWCNRK